jgi:cysteinyl-tRNA synthetase
MMQAHYRSTLDITETGLDAAEKGLSRLLEGLKLMEKISHSASTSFKWKELIVSFDEAMQDDFNAPILIANLFEAVRYINLINDGKETITIEHLEILKTAMQIFIFQVLGLFSEEQGQDNRLNPVMDLVLNLRSQAREQKDWTTSDKIRDGLAAAGIVVKDGKEGTTWS